MTTPKRTTLSNRNTADLAFQRASLILPNRIVEDGWLTVSKGNITKIGRGRLPKVNCETIDVNGDYLSPGFIDIHVHGGGGSDFMDGSREAVMQAMRTHAAHGVTTLYPTTTTASPQEIMAMVAACREYQECWTPILGPRLPGIHLYGPYFAPEKSGCHSSEQCYLPKKSQVSQFFATGMIRIATCAAELKGAAMFYQLARKAKCLVTCGHSNASWTEMAEAFNNGARHVDHFWCAMSNVSSVRTRFGTPMQGSMLEYVLAHPLMSTEVIADGFHLAPELLAFALQMKGVKRLCLVSDANRAVDCPRGRYRFGNDRSGTWFTNDGNVGRDSKGSLASSVKSLDHMVRIMFRDSGGSLSDVIQLASRTPARLTGMGRKCGSIAVGKQADLVILNQTLNVRRVFIAGEAFQG